MHFQCAALPKHLAREVTFCEIVEMVEQALSNSSDAQQGGALSGSVPKLLCRPGVKENRLGNSRKHGLPDSTPSLPLSLQVRVGPATWDVEAQPGLETTYQSPTSLRTRGNRG